jgi:hypothetical protein
MGCEDGVVARWWDAFRNRMELNIVIILQQGSPIASKSVWVI